MTELSNHIIQLHYGSEDILRVQPFQGMAQLKAAINSVRGCLRKSFTVIEYLTSAETFVKST